MISLITAVTELRKFRASAFPAGALFVLAVVAASGSTCWSLEASAAGPPLPGIAAAAPPLPEVRLLTPENHNALHPALAQDGKKMAYVRHLPPGLDLGSEAVVSGEEIWVMDLPAGVPRRLVGSEHLTSAGLNGIGYSLHKLVWSPDGGRLAFTWYDGNGWGQVALAGSDGKVQVVPAPVIQDPWELGASFSLSSSQFLWHDDGKSGSFAAWDDECGTLYSVKLGEREPAGQPRPAGSVAGMPAVHSSRRLAGGGVLKIDRPEPFKLSRTCRNFFQSTGGYWFFSEFDEDFTQKLTVMDEEGRRVDSMVFPQGRPVKFMWARGFVRKGKERPVLVGWWLDPDRKERVLFTWEKDAIIEWLRTACRSDCGESAALVGGRIFYLAGEPGATRLMSLDRPGGEPRDLEFYDVVDLLPDPAGRFLLAVRYDRGKRSIWRVNLQ
jgi:hypothetical protein